MSPFPPCHCDCALAGDRPESKSGNFSVAPFPFVSAYCLVLDERLSDGARTDGSEVECGIVCRVEDSETSVEVKEGSA